MPLERGLFALLVVLLAFAVYRILTAAVLRRRTTRGLLLEAYQLGRPAILYFTMPTCAPCKTVQAPALTEVQARFGTRLQVIEVDVTRSPSLADRWGVLSVPTTFIIDASGRPRGVNHGVARANMLERQLQAVGEHPAHRRAVHRSTARVADD